MFIKMILVFAEFLPWVFFSSNKLLSRSNSSVRLRTSATSSSSKKKQKPSLSLCWCSLTFFTFQALTLVLASCLDFLLFLTRFHENLFLLFPSVVQIFVQSQQNHFFSLQWPLTSNQCYQWGRTLYCWQSDNNTTKAQPFRCINKWIYHIPNNE